MITVVSGFQRCGSSLMMQMLAAGGMPVFHDPEMGYPSYETTRQLARPDPVWFASCDGHALKWLEPQRMMPPVVDVPIRVLWMKRDYNQQARSAVKFISHVMGLDLPGSARRKMAAGYKRDERPSMQLWEQRGRVMVVAFEGLIERPDATAMAVSLFLDHPLDTGAMAAQVKARPTDCLPGFLELDLLGGACHQGGR